VQNRTFRFVVGSGLWTQLHKWLILAHSSHPSIAEAMSPAEIDLLAWGLWGRERIVLPGVCAIASRNAHLCRFEVLAHFFASGSLDFNQGGGCQNLRCAAHLPPFPFLLCLSRCTIHHSLLCCCAAPRKRSGQKAVTYNGLLRQAGKPGRLVETKLKTKAGRPPWVAGKNTFRDLYKLV
jgi:hypothetical protein